MGLSGSLTGTANAADNLQAQLDAANNNLTQLAQYVMGLDYAQQSITSAIVSTGIATSTINTTVTNQVGINWLNPTFPTFNTSNLPYNATGQFVNLSGSVPTTASSVLCETTIIVGSFTKATYVSFQASATQSGQSISLIPNIETIGVGATWVNQNWINISGQGFYYGVFGGLSGTVFSSLEFRFLGYC